jgi:hypothetical protein
MEIMNEMAFEANKMALSACLRSASKSEGNESVMMGDFLDIAVANFKRAGFSIAGTDSKLFDSSQREAVMLDDNDVLVSIANVVEEKTVTKISVRPLLLN